MCLRLQRYSYTHASLHCLCMWGLATERQKFDVWQKKWLVCYACACAGSMQCIRAFFYPFIYSISGLKQPAKRTRFAIYTYTYSTIGYIFWIYINRIKCCNDVEFFVGEQISESSFHVKFNCESNEFKLPNRFCNFLHFFFSLKLISCNHAHIVYSKINELICCAIAL